MSTEISFEYEALKHYSRKGIFARTGLISQLILDLREISKKERSAMQEYGINENEGIAVLQIAIVSHIMMLIEDLAIICKSIREGKINYYAYLDKTGEEDLGKIIGEFYSEINEVHVEELSKILSYADLSSFEFVSESEKSTVVEIINQMIERSRIFFNKVTFFRMNHIKIFRRYKHAGFPILLSQNIHEEVKKIYEGFEFVSISLTSRTKISDEMVPLPYSEKAITSYENLTKDILSFLGSVVHSKLICIERKMSGLIPYKDNLFGINFSKKEIDLLDEIWKRIESKSPLPEDKSEITVKTNTEILRWYTEIENSSKRIM